MSELTTINVSELIKQENLANPIYLNIGQLYAIHFANGMVKCGKTGNLYQRAHNIARGLRSNIISITHTPFIRNVSKYEKILLDLCERCDKANYNSEFVNNDYTEVVKFMSCLGWDSLCDNEIKKIQLEHSIRMDKFLERSLGESFSKARILDSLHIDLNSIPIDEEILYWKSFLEHSMIYEIVFEETLKDFFIKYSLSIYDIDFRKICLIDFDVPFNDIKTYKDLCRLNTSMIDLGMGFEDRKEKLHIRYAQLVAKLLK